MTEPLFTHKRTALKDGLLTPAAPLLALLSCIACSGPSGNDATPGASVAADAPSSPVSSSPQNTTANPSASLTSATPTGVAPELSSASATEPTPSSPTAIPTVSTGFEPSSTTSTTHAPSSSSSGQAGASGSVNPEGTGGVNGMGGSGPDTTPQAGGADAGGSPGAGGTAGGTGGGAGVETPEDEERLISFGTRRGAGAVVAAARQLAESLADPDAASWRATGDQSRTYPFAETEQDEPYRLYVPTDWDGQTELPLMMFLHGAGSDENTYVDQNNQQMLELAEQHGFLLVSPLGAAGAYGSFLRLTAPFGDEAGAAELMSQVTPESERTNAVSEQDVINVLELVLSEYPIDRTQMFLAGHSMGSGGTWYIGGKYADYWRALAPMSGPFVQESGYPWDDVAELSILVTEGIQTPSLDASRLLRDWLSEQGFDAEYLEVDADHGQMVGLVLPDVFDFFAGAQAR